MVETVTYSNRNTVQSTCASSFDTIFMASGRHRVRNCFDEGTKGNHPFQGLDINNMDITDNTKELNIHDLAITLNEMQLSLSELKSETTIGFDDSKSFLQPLLRNQIEDAIPKTTFINEKVDLVIEKINNLNNEVHILKQEVLKTKRLIEAIEVKLENSSLKTSSIHESVKSIEENSSYTSNNLKRIIISTRNFFLVLPFAFGFGIIFRFVDSFFGNPIKNFFDSIKLPGI